ncbi:MAG: GNAT family N-acetyltransferase [Ilumatobacteraceae bacterium]
MTSYRVLEIATVDTYALRGSVLRHDTPITAVEFAEDDWAGVVHLGVVDEDAPPAVLVATSTWVPRPFHDPVTLEVTDSAVQLRGMATDRSLQGRGIGGMLIDEAVTRMRAAGFAVAWARARDAALVFYARHGFEARGDGFVDEGTQLPHHVVVCHL